MIKVTTKHGETDLSVIGDLQEICADTVMIVDAIRKSLAEHSPICARIYEEEMRKRLISAAFDREPKKEEAEKKDDEATKAAEAKVDDFIDKLVDLIGELIK